MARGSGFKTAAGAAGVAGAMRMSGRSPAASVAIGVATSVAARKTFNSAVKKASSRKGGGGKRSGQPTRDAHGRFNGWSK